MTLQEPTFPPAHSGAEKPACESKSASRKATARNKKPASNSRKRKRPRRTGKQIPGLYYPTNITPEEFFKSLGKLKKKAELEIERLLTFLDQADGYTYDEREDEPDNDNADDEPILGAAEPVGYMNPFFDQARAWKETGQEGEDLEGDELDEKEGCELDDGESDCDGMGRRATVDDEPSLGSLDRRMDQTEWGQADFTPNGATVWTDAEYDEADFEEVDVLDEIEGPEDTGICSLDALAEQTGICFGILSVE